MDKRDLKLQELGKDLVGREVFACVSMLVSEIAKNIHNFERSDYHEEDVYQICAQDDWQSPAEEEGYGVRKVFDVTEGEDGSVEATESDEWQWFKDEEISGDIYDTEQEAWRAACEDNSLDPYQHEAYEHWIVSDWLARKLEAKGEMVSHDFFGLTIWGRCCTGQAIGLDGVIQEIAAELWPEELIEDKPVTLQGE